MNRLMVWAQAIRIHHSVKNGLLLLPVLSGSLDGHQLVALCAAIWSLSALQSCGYLINDWRDRDDDALHPEKCQRPLVSGQISVSECRLAQIALIVSSAAPLFLLFWLGYTSIASDIALVLSGYAALFGAYTYLKHCVMVDVIVLSLFYVLRVAGGYWVSGHDLYHCASIASLSLPVFLLISTRKRHLEIAVRGCLPRFVNTQHALSIAVYGRCYPLLCGAYLLLSCAISLWLLPLEYGLLSLVLMTLLVLHTLNNIPLSDNVMTEILSGRPLLFAVSFLAVNAVSFSSSGILS